MAAWASGRVSRSAYVGASDKAKRLFRLLALLDLPFFSGWMSAALLDLPFAEAEDLLDELITAQLVETMGTGLGREQPLPLPRADPRVRTRAAGGR